MSRLLSPRLRRRLPPTRRIDLATARRDPPSRERPLRLPSSLVATYTFLPSTPTATATAIIGETYARKTRAGGGGALGGMPDDAIAAAYARL